jgi:aldehyde:ferredoxin oxidoreductase
MKITTLTKNILEINLDKKTFQVKSRTDLNDVLGGVGLSLKLYSEFRNEKPLIFSIGPLNGFFPFASKTSIFFGVKEKVYDYYLGGSLSSRIKYCNLDAIVILGRSKNEIFLDIQDHNVTFLDYGVEFESQGLPGKRSILSFQEDKYLLDNFFQFPSHEADAILNYKRIMGIIVSGTANFTLNDFSEYNRLYKQILSKYQLLSVDKDNKPSCAGCPMGCSNSSVGEKGGSLLAHSLVGCQFAKRIFNNHDLIISCLNSLGYHYTHEDLEKYQQTLYNLKNEYIFQ